MKAIAIVALLAGCGGTSQAEPAKPAAPGAARARTADDQIVDAMLARLGKAAKCPDSRRVWCIAADGWAKGIAAPLPDGDRALVGVTVALEKDRDDVDLLATDVALSVLAVRGAGDGRLGLITDIPPENAAEKRIVRAAVTSIGKVLKGEAERVELAPSLARVVESYPAQASYPLAVDNGSWAMAGKSSARLRKVGLAWVAIEVPHNGPEGIFVSIYPEPP